MENKYYVYEHHIPNRGVFYVGKGSGDRAWRKSAKRNKYWQDTVNKYSKRGYTVRIIQGYLTEDEAYLLEKEIISMYKEQGIKLCNYAEGGRGNIGSEFSQESCYKMSKSRSGTNCYQTDLDVHTFIHVSGEVFTGLRVEFQAKYGMTIESLFYKKPDKQHKGWALFQNKDTAFSRYYQKRYVVEHEDGTIFSGNILDFEKAHGTFPYSIIRQDSGHFEKEFGWVLVESLWNQSKGADNTCADNSRYVFTHISGEIFQGTRHDFSKKYLLILNLFGDKCKNKSSHGWRAYKIEE